MRRVPSAANFCERANKNELGATRLYICRKNLPKLESPPPAFPLSSFISLCPALTLVSNFGKSISTGQASLHAPHSDEACASGTKSGPKKPAEMTEPIGPG